MMMGGCYDGGGVKVQGGMTMAQQFFYNRDGLFQIRAWLVCVWSSNHKSLTTKTPEIKNLPVQLI